MADKAEKDLIRIEKLFKDSATTSTEVDILKTRRDLALSDLLVAQYNKEHTEIIFFSSLITAIIEIWLKKQRYIQKLLNQIFSLFRKVS